MSSDLASAPAAPKRPYDANADKVSAGVDHLVSVCALLLVGGAAKVRDRSLFNLFSTKRMNLVLFAHAVEHLARIARIIKQQRGGHGLLVGMGDSLVTLGEEIKRITWTATNQRSIP
jgi:hypothetical protein